MGIRLSRFLLLLIPLVPLTAGAQDTGVSGTSLEFFRPSVDSFGFFGVNDPQLLKAGQSSFKISQSYAGGGPFRIAINGVSVPLVDRVATTDLVAAVGISDFLTLALDVPFHPYAREADFNTTLPFTTSSLGDIRAAFKFRVLAEGPRRPGMALLIGQSFPTGNEMKFLGTSHVVPSVELLVGKELGFARFAVNAGARFPEQKNVLGVNFDDQITYGAAVGIPFGFLDPLLAVVGEIRGHFEPNRLRITTAPVEFAAGLRKDFRNGLSLSAGGGGAWNNAIGNPRMRGLFALSYSPALLRPQKGPVEERRRQLATTAYFAGIRLRDESAGWIRELAEKSRKDRKTDLVITGFRDAGEKPALARRRAEAARRILVEGGVPANRIEIQEAKGVERIARLNRRVEITVRSP